MTAWNTGLKVWMARGVQAPCHVCGPSAFYEFLKIAVSRK